MALLKPEQFITRTPMDTWMDKLASASFKDMKTFQDLLKMRPKSSNPYTRPEMSQAKADELMSWFQDNVKGHTIEAVQQSRDWFDYKNNTWQVRRSVSGFRINGVLVSSDRAESFIGYLVMEARKEGLEKGLPAATETRKKERF